MCGWTRRTGKVDVLQDWHVLCWLVWRFAVVGLPGSDVKGRTRPSHRFRRHTGDAAQELVLLRTQAAAKVDDFGVGVEVGILDAVVVAVHLLDEEGRTGMRVVVMVVDAAFVCLRTCRVLATCQRPLGELNGIHTASSTVLSLPSWLSPAVKSILYGLLSSSGHELLLDMFNYM